VSHEFSPVYACTHIQKEACEDEFTKGEKEGTRVTTVSEGCHITASSLHALFAAIDSHFVLDPGLVEAHSVGDGVRYDSDNLTYVAFERLETVDCECPNEVQLAAWRAGKFKCYTARYEFAIEARMIRKIAEDELEAARSEEASHHFSFGDSTNGPIGMCARVRANSPMEALEQLRAYLPEEIDAKSGMPPEIEYMRIYINSSAVCLADMDEINPIEDDN